MKKKKSVREAKIARLQDYKSAFESESGKRVLWELMKECRFLEISTTAQDPYTTCFNDGKRSLILHIINRLKYDPKIIMNFIEEGVEDDSRGWNSAD